MSVETSAQTQAASQDAKTHVGIVLTMLGLVLFSLVFLATVWFFIMTKDITILLFGATFSLMPALILAVVLYFVLRGRKGTGGVTSR